MKQLILSLIGFCAAMSVASCGSDNGPASEVWYTDMVTCLENEATGSRFRFQAVDDSPVYTLSSPSKINNSNIVAGKRLMITYSLPDGRQYPSDGEISLRSYHVINFDTLRVVSLSDYPPERITPIELSTVIRAGNYINITGLVTFSDLPRTFMLAADRETLDSEMPRLYLFHILGSPVDSFNRMFYASFEISPVWERESCRGIEICIPNTNHITQKFTFVKSRAE